MSVAVEAIDRRTYIREISARTLRRRQVRGGVYAALCGVALLIALIPIVAIILYTGGQGIGAWSAAFFTHVPTPEGIPGGGISNALVGSLIIDGIASLMAIPVGIIAALFLAEQRNAFASAVRFIVDVASGLPAITIGLFAYAIVVIPQGHFSAFSASVALAVLMLPVVIRASEGAIRAVPTDLWEAGVALGVRRARVARTVILPAALSGLITASLLAISRAVGEAAPLLFTSPALTSRVVTDPTRQMSSLPLIIFQDGIQAYADLQRTAWGTALTLLVIVVLLNLSARVLARRMRRYTR
jgi:phosphate transport system permease protein